MTYWVMVCSGISRIFPETECKYVKEGFVKITETIIFPIILLR